jgi:hypothetical protein
MLSRLICLREWIKATSKALHSLMDAPADWLSRNASRSAICSIWMAASSPSGMSA